MGELGQLLREARERQGLSLEQVEEKTKIRKKYLMALEEEDHDSLPDKVYARGFVRNYALFLGLDPEEPLRLYDEASAPEGRVQALETESIPLGRSWLSVDLLVAILILMGIAAFGYYLYGRFSPSIGALPFGLGAIPTSSPTVTFSPVAFTLTPPVAVPTSTPEKVPPLVLSLTPTTPSSGVQVRIETVQRVWLRVRVDGRQVFEGVLDPGFSWVWEGRREVYLRCGNAGGVKAVVNGREQGPLGASGAVVDRIWVTGGVTPTPTRAIISATVTASPTLTGEITATLPVTITE